MENSDYKEIPAQKFYVREKMKNEVSLSNPYAVYAEMKEISEADQECFYVIYCNQKNHMIGKDIISLGGVSSTFVDPRILFRRVLIKGAAGFFVVHNHPSGAVEPSENDKEMTKTIKKISDVIGVRFLDHLIIGNDSYYSFNAKTALLQEKH